MHSYNTIKKSPHSSADSFYGVEVQGVKYKGRAAELLLNLKLFYLSLVVF